VDNEQLLSAFLSLVNIEGFEDRYKEDIADGKFFGMPLNPIVEAEQRLISPNEKCLAYFSMEYGLATSFYNRFTTTRQIDSKNIPLEQEIFSNNRLADYFFTLKLDSLIDLPIYSGGLGVLAGDTVKTMADYRLSAVAVGVLWNSGYFRQRFWFKYGQLPSPMFWDADTYPGLIPLKNRIKITLRSEELSLRLWKYYVYSYNKDYAVPLILLDADIEENNEKIRRLTAQLYRTDDAWIKIMQRVILGMGGVAALKGLGYNIGLHHMNEGHAVFSFVEKARGASKEQLDELKRHFVYTCHTPVEAGHDRFPAEEVKKVLLKEDYEVCEEFGKDKANAINLTLFAMNVSSATNAVSKSHGDVMHIQFPQYKKMIQYVTNGVHAHTWMSESFKKLLEAQKTVVGDFRANPMALSKVSQLKDDEQFRKKLWDAHRQNKEGLCKLFEKWKFDPDVFTICWARRFAAYKRPSLIMQDVKKLIELSQKIGPLQIIFAGKAHPKDNLGFTFINTMLDKIDSLVDAYETFKIAMPENYEISLARILTSSVDVWLNNPLPPFEASGTSGMKAILNSVVQLSTLDGWVVEAAEKNIGRIFGYKNPEGSIGDEKDLHMAEDSGLLYAALEELMKLYYAANPKGGVKLDSEWIDLMINCLAASSHFNTYRMLDQYKHNIWKIN